MTDIYDRSKWPAPEANPLVLMLKRSDEWYSNEETVAALGLSRNRVLMGQNTIFDRQVADEDVMLEAPDFLIKGKYYSPKYTSGRMRYYSRRALVIAAMRTNTATAAAFRDWMATQIAEGC